MLNISEVAPPHGSMAPTEESPSTNEAKLAHQQFEIKRTLFACSFC